MDPTASRLQFIITSSWQNLSTVPEPNPTGIVSIRIVNPHTLLLPPMISERHLDVEISDDGSAASHAAAIQRTKEFFFKHRTSARTIFVSCPMGISRSTALTLGLMYLEYQDERQALDHLFQTQPQALPNLEILTAWDGMLGSRLTREYLKHYSQRTSRGKESWKNPTGSGRIPGCPTPHPASPATPS